MNAGPDPTGHAASETVFRPPGRRAHVPALLAVLLALSALSPLAAHAQSASSIGVNISFAPGTIASGGSSQMTIAFSISNNPDNSPAAVQATFVDNLPPGMRVVNGTQGSCAGASAGAGATAITFAGDGTIPAGGCSVTVTVTAQTAAGSSYFTNTIPAGAVQTTLGTNPAPASATLTVQAAVPVPDVTGQTQAAASALLTAAGFVVAVSQVPNATVPLGGVVGTQPAAGTLQARQSTITLLISAGPGTYAGSISTLPNLTPGQASVARALEQVCAASAAATAAGTQLSARLQDLFSKCTSIISDAVSGSGGPLGQTLNAVSGRQATAAARVPMQFGAGQVANLSDRLSAVRSGASGVSISGLGALDSSGRIASLAPLTDFLRTLLGGSLGGGAGDEPGGLLDNRLGIFATGTFRQGSQDSTAAESGFDLRSTVLSVGADYRFGNSLILGLSGGFGRSTTGFDNNGGRLDARHLSGQLYGSYFSDHYHVDGVLGFGHNDYNLRREIGFLSSDTGIGCNGVYCSNETTGSTGARQLLASLSAGGDFHAEAFSFGPTAEVEYKQVRVNGFTEDGPSGLDLTFGGITTPSLVAKVGGYASYAWKTPWMVILPQLRARYEHEFQNDGRTQSVQFAADNLPGAASRSFLVYTDAADRSFFDWKASVLFQFPYGIAGFVDYGGVEGLQNIRVHEFNVGLRIEH